MKQDLLYSVICMKFQMISRNFPQKTIEGEILEASLNVFWVVKDDVFHPFV